jgi:hypothetical protein
MTISIQQFNQWISEFQEKKEKLVNEFQNKLFNHPDSIELLAYEHKIVQMVSDSIRPSFFIPVPDAREHHLNSDDIEWLSMNTADLIKIHDAFLKVYPDSPMFDDVVLASLRKAHALRCLFDISSYETTTLIDVPAHPLDAKEWTLEVSMPWVSDLLNIDGYDKYGLDIAEKFDSLVERSFQNRYQYEGMVQIGGHIPTIQRGDSLGVLARFRSEHGDAGQVYVEAGDEHATNVFTSYDEMY